ncbi:MAG: SCO family protein [Acidimicrobiales bacterium]
MSKRMQTTRRSRRQRSALVVLAAVLGLLGSACGGNGAANGLANPMGLKGVIRQPPVAKPDFTLTDTENQPFNIKTGTAGDVLLLYFGYTNCPDDCPTTMAHLALSLKKVSPSVRSHVKVVFVTTDPNRDSTAVLRHWLDDYNSSFIGLWGTVPQIDAAEASVGLPPAIVVAEGNGQYTDEHSTIVLAFTTDNEAHAEYPEGYGVTTWIHDLPRLVKGIKA